MRRDRGNTILRLIIDEQVGCVIRGSRDGFSVTGAIGLSVPVDRGRNTISDTSDCQAKWAPLESS